MGCCKREHLRHKKACQKKQETCFHCMWQKRHITLQDIGDDIGSCTHHVLSRIEYTTVAGYMHVMHDL